MGYWDSEGIFYHTGVYWSLVTESMLYIRSDYAEGYNEWLQSYKQEPNDHKITQEFNADGSLLKHSNSLVSKAFVQNKTKLPEDCSGMFSECSSLTRFSDETLFDFSECKNLSYFLNGCHQLTYIQLSLADFSSCTHLTGMFSDCGTLRYIYSSGSSKAFKNVVDASYLFNWCPYLDMQYATSFLSLFDFSNCTDVSRMFYQCCHADVSEEIDLSDIFPKKTSKMINFEEMFYGCINLVTLKLWEFDMKYDSNITEMFRACYALSTIYCYIDSWYIKFTENVFTGCRSLPGYTQEGYGESSLCCHSTKHGGYFTSYEKYDNLVYFNYKKVLSYYTVYKNDTKWTNIYFNNDTWVLEDS